MRRCVVLIRSHEPLREGWRKRSVGPAGPLLENGVKVPGVRFDETYHPVQVWRRVGGGDDPAAPSAFNYGRVGPVATYAVRAEADDDDAIGRLRRDRHAEIVGVFADPAVSPCPSGYCGADCPDKPCGAGDVGPGASIHGANSHPDVVTVAAVTVTDRRLGYSSQGPGALYSRKPDLAGFSHFKGSGIYPADGGTSAAGPVAAGVAAALRQRFTSDRLAPAQLKGLLQRTARDLGGDGWDYDLGYGVINAAAALKAVGSKPQARRHPRTAL